MKFGDLTENLSGINIINFFPKFKVVFLSQQILRPGAENKKLFWFSFYIVSVIHYIVCIG